MEPNTDFEFKTTVKNVRFAKDSNLRVETARQLGGLYLAARNIGRHYGFEATRYVVEMLEAWSDEDFEHFEECLVFLEKVSSDDYSEYVDNPFRTL